ncbi:serine hydrolase domain-containing protein [Bacillus haynesii]|uniref:serine hydrolase domain-containing protein n=1 Tax=Bacillus haynesii TaxID=1925021 RepID=UPI0003EDA07E|nr:serine hydrolase [Bacillus haynesii]EWH20021.1 penicillin-binding protein [Bacillus haynesii]
MDWDKVKEQLENTFNGTVLLAQDETVLLQGAYGEASIQTHAPMQLHQRFNLASVSKSITALGIILLVQENKIALDDDINQWFAALPYPDITVRHLLQHTSGLPDFLELFSKHWDQSKFATNEDVFQLLTQYMPPRLFDAGERIEYSNTGYVLLALLIERVTKKSFSNYMSDAIFKPLNMTHTTVTSIPFTEKYANEIAHGYVYDVYKGQYIDPKEFEETKGLSCLNYLTGDGGVYSTAADLWTLGRAVIHAQLWDDALLKQAFTPLTLTAEQPFAYGLGWFIHEDEHLGKCVWHGGNWPGYATTFKIYPETKTIFVFLRSKEQEFTYESAIGEAIKKALITNELHLPKKPKQYQAVHLPLETLQRYVGTYQLQEDPHDNIEVSLQEDHRLYIFLPNTMPLELHAIKEDEFFLRGLGVLITIKQNILTVITEHQKTIAKKQTLVIIQANVAKHTDNLASLFKMIQEPNL